jgi:hypothetical protein
MSRHVVALDAFVAARLPLESSRDAVQIELLVERHGGRGLHPEAVDALVQLEAPRGVHRALRLIDHPVEVGVVVVAEDIPRPEQRHVDQLGVVRRCSPPE